VKRKFACGARGEARIEIMKDACVRKFSLERLAPDGAGLYDRGEAGGAEIANNAQVIAAERAGAYDDVIDRLGHTQWPALPSTAWRQRV
jgi:hypothetical protein